MLASFAAGVFVAASIGFASMWGVAYNYQIQAVEHGAGCFTFSAWDHKDAVFHWGACPNEKKDLQPRAPQIKVGLLKGTKL